MNKERLNTIVSISSALGLFYLAFLVLNRKQRQWILDRDDRQCQMPQYDEERGWHNCGSTDRLEVHHITPSRWGKAQGMTEEELDSPRNLITLCFHHHQEVIHPDMKRARDDYGRQKRRGIKKPDSFERAFKKRDEAVRRRDHYWNDLADDALREVAEERTDNYVIKGHKYPRKRRK